MKKEELKDFCKSIGIDCVGIAGVIKNCFY